MKSFLIGAAFVATGCLSAQAQFKAGSYVLTAEAPARRSGALKFSRFGDLMLKNPDGSKISFTPQQVTSFQIGPRKYTTASNFEVPMALGMTNKVPKAFVEQLDSGQVVLLRYEFTTTIYSSAGGAPYGSSSEHWLYMLYTPHNQSLVVLPPNMLGYAGHKFREALAPFLESRLDLNAIVNIDNLPAVIHALNTDAPYDPAFSSGH